MLRGLLVVGAATLTVAAALATIGTADARTGSVVTLRGAVGPGFTITLKRNGKAVKRLAPGAYRFVIADRSPIHNFELEREQGGVSKHELTHVSFTGTKTVTITLGKGLWKFYCGPHEAMMAGSFRVGAGTTASTTTDDHGGKR